MSDVVSALSNLDVCEQLEKSAELATVEVDRFIDGVESAIKTAGLNVEQGARVWDAISLALEKHADTAPAATPRLTPTTLGEGLLKGEVAGRAAIETNRHNLGQGYKQLTDQLNTAEYPLSDVAQGAQYGAIATGARGTRKLLERQGTALDTLHNSATQMIENDRPLNRVKSYLSGIDWKNPETYGKAVPYALGGAGLGLLGTALLGRKDEQGRKSYLRNALLAAILGGGAGAVAAPYINSKFSGPAAATQPKV